MISSTDAISKVKKEFTGLTSLKVDGITGLSWDEGKYVVSLEVLEKKSIPDGMDVIGMYEVRLDDDGNVMSFQRKRLRKRADTQET